MVDRWICVYPVYINSKKSLAEGRKIAKEKVFYDYTDSHLITIFLFQSILLFMFV